MRTFALVLLLACSASAAAQTTHVYPTAGVAISLRVPLAGPLAYEFHDSIPTVVGPPSNWHLVNRDTLVTARSSVGGGLGLSLTLGMLPRIGPWLAPFGGFDIVFQSDGDMPAGSGSKILFGYYEAGLRLNAALPNARVVPFATAARSYRDITYKRNGPAIISNNGYDSGEDSFGGAGWAYGAGFQVSPRTACSPITWSVEYLRSSGSLPRWGASGEHQVPMTTSRVVLTGSAHIPGPRQRAACPTIWG